jgi:hypothetical protein
VWVKHKQKHVRGQNDIGVLTDEGLPYRDGDEDFRLFEQSSIVGIIAQPAEEPHLLDVASILAN